MPLASVMPRPVPMAAYDQKGHVALHFDCLDLINVMLQFTVPFALCDANTNANGIS